VRGQSVSLNYHADTAGLTQLR